MSSSTLIDNGFHHKNYIHHNHNYYTDDKDDYHQNQLYQNPTLRRYEYERQNHQHNHQYRQHQHHRQHHHFHQHQQHRQHHHYRQYQHHGLHQYINECHQTQHYHQIQQSAHHQRHTNNTIDLLTAYNNPSDIALNDDTYYNHYGELPSFENCDKYNNNIIHPKPSPPPSQLQMVQISQNPVLNLYTPNPPKLTSSTVSSRKKEHNSSGVHYNNNNLTHQAPNQTSTIVSINTGAFKHISSSNNTTTTHVSNTHNSNVLTKSCNPDTATTSITANSISAIDTHNSNDGLKPFCLINTQTPNTLSKPNRPINSIGSNPLVNHTPPVNSQKDTSIPNISYSNSTHNPDLVVMDASPTKATSVCEEMYQSNFTKHHDDDWENSNPSEFTKPIKSPRVLYFKSNNCENDPITNNSKVGGLSHSFLHYTIKRITTSTSSQKGTSRIIKQFHGKTVQKDVSEKDTDDRHIPQTGGQEHKAIRTESFSSQEENINDLVTSRSEISCFGESSACTSSIHQHVQSRGIRNHNWNKIKHGGHEKRLLKAKKNNCPNQPIFHNMPHLPIAKGKSNCLSLNEIGNTKETTRQMQHRNTLFHTHGHGVPPHLDTSIYRVPPTRNRKWFDEQAVNDGMTRSEDSRLRIPSRDEANPILDSYNNDIIDDSIYSTYTKKLKTITDKENQQNMPSRYITDQTKISSPSVYPWAPFTNIVCDDVPEVSEVLNRYISSLNSRRLQFGKKPFGYRKSKKQAVKVNGSKDRLGHIHLNEDGNEKLLSAAVTNTNTKESFLKSSPVSYLQGQIHPTSDQNKPHNCINTTTTKLHGKRDGSLSDTVSLMNQLYDVSGPSIKQTQQYNGKRTTEEQSDCSYSQKTNARTRMVAPNLAKVMINANDMTCSEELVSPPSRKNAQRITKSYESSMKNNSNGDKQHVRIIRTNKPRIEKVEREESVKDAEECKSLLIQTTKDEITKPSSNTDTEIKLSASQSSAIPKEHNIQSQANSSHESTPNEVALTPSEENESIHILSNKSPLNPNISRCGKDHSLMISGTNENTDKVIQSGYPVKTGKSPNSQNTFIPVQSKDSEEINASRNSPTSSPHRIAKMDILPGHAMQHSHFLRQTNIMDKTSPPKSKVTTNRKLAKEQVCENVADSNTHVDVITDIKDFNSEADHGDEPRDQTLQSRCTMNIDDCDSIHHTHSIRKCHSTESSYNMKDTVLDKNEVIKSGMNSGHAIQKQLPSSHLLNFPFSNYSVSPKINKRIGTKHKDISPTEIPMTIMPSKDDHIHENDQISPNNNHYYTTKNKRGPSGRQAKMIWSPTYQLTEKGSQTSITIKRHQIKSKRSNTDRDKIHHINRDMVKRKSRLTKSSVLQPSIDSNVPTVSPVNMSTKVSTIKDFKVPSPKRTEVIDYNIPNEARSFSFQKKGASIDSIVKIETIDLHKGDVGQYIKKPTENMTSGDSIQSNEESIPKVIHIYTNTNDTSKKKLERRSKVNTPNCISCEPLNEITLTDDLKQKRLLSIRRATRTGKHRCSQNTSVHDIKPKKDRKVIKWFDLEQPTSPNRDNKGIKQTSSCIKTPIECSNDKDKGIQKEKIEKPLTKLSPRSQVKVSSCTRASTPINEPEQKKNISVDWDEVRSRLEERNRRKFKSRLSLVSQDPKILIESFKNISFELDRKCDDQAMSKRDIGIKLQKLQSDRTGKYPQCASGLQMLHSKRKAKGERSNKCVARNRYRNYQRLPDSNEVIRLDSFNNIVVPTHIDEVNKDTLECDSSITHHKIRTSSPKSKSMYHPDSRNSSEMSHSRLVPDTYSSGHDTDKQGIDQTQDLSNRNVITTTVQSPTCGDDTKRSARKILIRSPQRIKKAQKDGTCGCPESNIGVHDSNTQIPENKIELSLQDHKLKNDCADPNDQKVKMILIQTFNETNLCTPSSKTKEKSTYEIQPHQTVNRRKIHNLCGETKEDVLDKRIQITRKSSQPCRNISTKDVNSKMTLTNTQQSIKDIDPQKCDERDCLTKHSLSLLQFKMPMSLKSRKEVIARERFLKRRDSFNKFLLEMRCKQGKERVTKQNICSPVNNKTKDKCKSVPSENKRTVSAKCIRDRKNDITTVHNEEYRKEKSPSQLDNKSERVISNIMSPICVNPQNTDLKLAKSHIQCGITPGKSRLKSIKRICKSERLTSKVTFRDSEKTGKHILNKRLSDRDTKEKIDMMCKMKIVTQPKRNIDGKTTPLMHFQTPFNHRESQVPEKKREQFEVKKSACDETKYQTNLQKFERSVDDLFKHTDNKRSCKDLREPFYQRKRSNVDKHGSQKPNEDDNLDDMTKEKTSFSRRITMLDEGRCLLRPKSKPEEVGSENTNLRENTHSIRKRYVSRDCFKDNKQSIRKMTYKRSKGLSFDNVLSVRFKSSPPTGENDTRECHKEESALKANVEKHQGKIHISKRSILKQTSPRATDSFQKDVKKRGDPIKRLRDSQDDARVADVSKSICNINFEKENYQKLDTNTRRTYGGINYRTSRRRSLPLSNRNHLGKESHHRDKTETTEHPPKTGSRPSLDANDRVDVAKGDPKKKSEFTSGKKCLIQDPFLVSGKPPIKSDICKISQPRESSVDRKRNPILGNVCQHDRTKESSAGDESSKRKRHIDGNNTVRGGKVVKPILSMQDSNKIDSTNRDKFKDTITIRPNNVRSDFGATPSDRNIPKSAQNLKSGERSFDRKTGSEHKIKGKQELAKGKVTNDARSKERTDHNISIRDGKVVKPSMPTNTGQEHGVEKRGKHKYDSMVQADKLDFRHVFGATPNKRNIQRGKQKPDGLATVLKKTGPGNYHVKKGKDLSQKHPRSNENIPGKINPLSQKDDSQLLLTTDKVHEPTSKHSEKETTGGKGNKMDTSSENVPLTTMRSIKRRRKGSGDNETTRPWSIEVSKDVQEANDGWNKLKSKIEKDPSGKIKILPFIKPANQPAVAGQGGDYSSPPKRRVKKTGVAALVKKNQENQNLYDQRMSAQPPAQTNDDPERMPKFVPLKQATESTSSIYLSDPADDEETTSNSEDWFSFLEHSDENSTSDDDDNDYTNEGIANKRNAYRRSVRWTSMDENEDEDEVDSEEERIMRMFAGDDSLQSLSDDDDTRSLARSKSGMSASLAKRQSSAFMRSKSTDSVAYMYKSSDDLRRGLSMAFSDEMDVELPMGEIFLDNWYHHPVISRQIEAIKQSRGKGRRLPPPGLKKRTRT